MNRVSTCWRFAVATFGALTTSSSGAQVARPYFDLQPMGVSAPAVAPTSVGLGSGLLWQTSRNAAWLRGSAELFGGSFAPRTFDGELRSRLVQLGPFDLGVDGRAQLDVPREGGRYGLVASNLRLGTRAPEYGIRVGAGASAARVPGQAVVAPSAQIGGWIRVLGISASGELSMGSRPGFTTFDTVVPRTVGDTGYWVQTDSGLVHVGGSHTEWVPVKLHQDARQRMNEARFALGARFFNVFVDGTGGLLFAENRGTRAHAMLMATRWVSPRVAITAGAGLRVIDPVAGLTRRSLVFGLRLAPQRVASGLVDAPNAAPAQFGVSRLGDHVRLSLRAPGARHVEIAGDFTEWNSVTLLREHGDVWAVSMPLKPGVYRLNVRVDDGEWVPPPGVSRTVDAYEGTVGVLIVS